MLDFCSVIRLKHYACTDYFNLQMVAVKWILCVMMGCSLLLFSRVVSDSDPVTCSTPGFPVLHCLLAGILQARILEWVAMPFSRGSSWPRDGPTCLPSSVLAGGLWTTSTTWEVQWHITVSELTRPRLLDQNGMELGFMLRACLCYPQNAFMRTLPLFPVWRGESSGEIQKLVFEI